MPDRILVTEIVGGGSAISELTVVNNSMQTIWKGAESIHAFGHLPNFALSQGEKLSAVVRSAFEIPSEIWAGGIGEWRQLTNNNSGLSPSWGKSESLEWTNDKFTIQGWLLPPARVESGKKYPMVVVVHGGPSGATMPEWPASFGMGKAIVRRSLSARLLCSVA